MAEVEGGVGGGLPIGEGPEEVVSAGDVEVADVDVPVFVGRQGLDEGGPVFGDIRRLSREESGGLEDAIDAGGAAGDVAGGSDVGADGTEFGRGKRWTATADSRHST